MPLSDLFLNQIQPGIAAFTGVPTAPPAGPIVMTPENQAAMMAPGSAVPVPPTIDPNLQQGLIPGVVNTGMRGAPAMVPGSPPPMPPPQDVAGATPPTAPSPQPAGPPPPQGPVMATMGGARAKEFMKAGPKALEKLGQAEDARSIAIEAERKAAETAATKEALAYQVQKDEAANQIQAGKDAQAEEDQRIARSQQRLNQVSQPLQKPIEDYFSDKTVGQKALMALSVAVGAIGQAFSRNGGPNVGMQILQQSMDQDARTKQMNFQRQVAVRDAAQQDYNNMVRQIGMKPASDMYKAGMAKAAAAQAGLLAAQSKIPDIQANATKAQAELFAKAREHEASALIGYSQATKGQRMVLDPAIGIPVPADKYADYKIKGALEGQKLEGDLTLAAAKEGRGKVSEGTKFIAEKAQAADIPGTIAAIDAAAEEFKKGNAAGVSTLGGVVKGGLGEKAYSAFYGKEASQREQDWGMLKSQIMKSITGAGMSDTERDRYDAILEGAKTPEARIHSIQRAREAIVNQLDTIKAGVGPEAAAQFDANLKAVSQKKIPSKPAK